jgi:DNA-directed RNA polymerase subunit N (RpoN/RPB10)
MGAEPMRCYTCGHPISDIYEVFLILREEHLKKLADGEEPEDKKFIDPDLNQNLMAVFEALRIDKYCCRQHFSTIRDIRNF